LHVTLPSVLSYGLKISENPIQQLKKSAVEDVKVNVAISKAKNAKKGDG
jgi:hypothetical protein